MSTPFPPPNGEQQHDHGWTTPGATPAHHEYGSMPPQQDWTTQDRIDSGIAQRAVAPLRPMTFGEIFESAFRVLRFNPRTMFGTSFVALAGVALLMLLLTAAVALPMFSTSSALDESWADGFSVTTNLWSAGISLVTFFLSGLLLPAVVDAVRGNRMTSGTAWQHVRGRLLALAGYGLLSALIMTTIVGIPVVLAVFLAFQILQPGDGAASGVLQFIAVIVLVLMLVVALATVVGTYLSLAAPAIVLERIGPVAGLRRSVGLVRGSFWRTLFILFAANLIVSIVSATVLGVSMFAGFAALAAAGLGSGTSTAIGVGAYALVMVLVNTFTLPFSATVVGLVYLDRRYRTEGLALDLARGTGQVTPGLS
ncbi:DUF7847 domain-containing protein [Gephyromycinifex aptenodytis]|uniref:DUF7847 domain-containing protein n=1 Tax=Gephyromycinifex aptenodytis TaxID=2716227 RepID=UPI0014486807|nr:hypothetical protein [Gephyromycinifex aptenodytis]